MTEYTIYCPVLSDANRSPHGSWQAWEDYLTDEVGGWSKLPGLARGSWRDEHGRDVLDHCRRYVIACHVTSVLPNVVDKAKELFGQRCIYVSIALAQIF